MTRHKLLQQEQFVRMPWKNGKGETLELLREEDDQGVKFRISQATVAESAPFSDFTGFERNLVLIKGKGVRLHHQSVYTTSHHHLQHILDIACFDGGDLTSAELIDGAVEDLNIMVRAKDHKARVEAIFAPCETLNTAQLTYFYANKESEISIDEGKQELRMPTESFLMMAKGWHYRLRAGSGILITIQAQRK